MDILGIGFWELIVIFLIALMVLGPRRLPEYAAKAGKVIRDLRSMSQGFLMEWRREITVAARLDELEETRRELQEARRLLQETHNSVSSETKQAAAETSRTVSDTKQAAKAGPKKTEQPAPPSPETPPVPNSAAGPEKSPAPADPAAASAGDEEADRTIAPPHTLPQSEPSAVNSSKVVNE